LPQPCYPSRPLFLRATKRIKDGKEHRYFSVVESVRHPGAKHPVQKPILYRGELNDSQPAAWAKARLVCAAATQQTQPRRLFPADRPPPPDPIPAVRVRWPHYELRPPRHFGAGWLPPNGGGSWAWTPSGPKNSGAPAKARIGPGPCPSPPPIA
jgi:hypothetical protein